MNRVGNETQKGSDDCWLLVKDKNFLIKSTLVLLQQDKLYIDVFWNGALVNSPLDFECKYLLSLFFHSSCDLWLWGLFSSTVTVVTFEFWLGENNFSVG